MKIALGSDLHLEFKTLVLKNDENADVLILSGDIMVASSLHEQPDVLPTDDFDSVIPNTNQEQALTFRKFLNQISEEFKEIIIIAGNHEFYHGRFPDAYNWMKQECAVYPNIHFLQNETYEINDITFIGATLWTDFNKGDPTTLQLIESKMNDFRIIKNSNKNYRKWSPEDALKAHRESLSYIHKTIAENPDKKYVMVGHHTPTPLSIAQEYQGDYYMNGGYSSDLSEFIFDHPQIVLWTCGHTHWPHRYYMGDTLVANNARGYAGMEECAVDYKLKYIDLDNMPTEADLSPDLAWR